MNLDEELPVSPADTARLLASIAELDAGLGMENDLIDPDVDGEPPIRPGTSAAGAADAGR